MSGFKVLLNTEGHIKICVYLTFLKRIIWEVYWRRRRPFL